MVEKVLRRVPAGTVKLHDSGYVCLVKPEEVTTVHLTGQGSVAAEDLEVFLSLNPNIKTVQVPPSYADRLVGPKFNEILARHEVRFLKSRLFPTPGYDHMSHMTTYERKKKLFEQILADPAKSMAFNHLLHQNLRGALVAYWYFDEEQPTLRQVAARLGIRPSGAQVELATLFHWLGFPVRDKKTILLANNLEIRLKKQDSKEANRRVREVEQFEYRVGNQLPPAYFSLKRKSIWWKVQILLRDEPGKLEQLQGLDQFGFEALCAYIHLNGTDSLEIVGNRFKRCRETARIHKDKALKFLEIP